MKALHIITLAASLSGVCSAATIIQTKSFLFVPAGTAPLTFNKFDTSLGTLTGITITTNVTKTGGSLFVDNESATAASGNISQSVTINLTSGVSLVDPSLSPFGGVTATSTYAASVGADDSDGPSVQTTGLDYDGTSFGPTSTSQTKSVSTLGFGGYQGLGTYVINADGVQGFNTSAIGGAAVAIDPATVSGDVTITYNYTAAIPEPASTLLGGIGMLALLRRRRH